MSSTPAHPDQDQPPMRDWVPAACTLPTEQQPLRVAEFDQLCASSLRGVDRPAPTLLRLLLDRSAAAAARDLTARESDCCTFFTFTLTTDPDVTDTVRLEVSVPGQHQGVLDALEAQARHAAGPAR